MSPQEPDAVPPPSGSGPPEPDRGLDPIEQVPEHLDGSLVDPDLAALITRALTREDTQAVHRVHLLSEQDPGLAALMQELGRVVELLDSARDWQADRRPSAELSERIRSEVVQRLAALPPEYRRVLLDGLSASRRRQWIAWSAAGGAVVLLFVLTFGLLPLHGGADADGAGLRGELAGQYGAAGDGSNGAVASTQMVGFFPLQVGSPGAARRAGPEPIFLAGSVQASDVAGPVWVELSFEVRSGGTGSGAAGLDPAGPGPIFEAVVCISPTGLRTEDGPEASWRRWTMARSYAWIELVLGPGEVVLFRVEQGQRRLLATAPLQLAASGTGFVEARLEIQGGRAAVLVNRDRVLEAPFVGRSGGSAAYVAGLISVDRAAATVHRPLLRYGD